MAYLAPEEEGPDEDFARDERIDREIEDAWQDEYFTKGNE
jgi:hypothetical protein